MLQKNNFKAYLALACVCFFWGTTYLGLRIGVADITPFFFTGIRQSAAGLLLIVFFIFYKKNRLSKKELLIHILSGFLMIAMGNGLVAWAEIFISSGLAAFICSLLPFWIIFVNLMMSKNAEKLKYQSVIGLSLGVLGLAIVFSDNLADFTNINYIWGIVAIFLANFCWALGTIATKNMKKTAQPLYAAGIQMFAGGVITFLLSLFLEDIRQSKFTFEATAALIYLILFGSILAFGAYLYALSKLPATLVSMYAYVNPGVALLLGWLILNEKLNSTIIVGFLITISGVFLVNQGFKPKKIRIVKIEKIKCTA